MATGYIKIREWYSEAWEQMVLKDFHKLRNVSLYIQDDKQMVRDKRKDLSGPNEISLPHINDESGWEYYCFPKRESTPVETVDPTDWNCRKPDLNELVLMDYVTTNALLNYHYEWLLFDDFPLT